LQCLRGASGKGHPAAVDGEGRTVTLLLVQPEDGTAALLDAIDDARRSMDLYVFRLKSCGSS
jgi:hypothetical protein